MSAGFFYGFLFGTAFGGFTIIGVLVAAMGRKPNAPESEPWACQEPYLRVLFRNG